MIFYNDKLIYTHYYSSVDNHFTCKKAHELISEYLQSFFKIGFI
jgi:hypothetical protein